MRDVDRVEKVAVRYHSPHGIMAVWLIDPYGMVTAWEHSPREDHGRTDLSPRENPGRARSFTAWGLGIVFAATPLEQNSATDVEDEDEYTMCSCQSAMFS